MNETTNVIVEAGVDADLECRFSAHKDVGKGHAIRFVRASTEGAADAVRAAQEGRNVRVIVVGCPCETAKIRDELGADVAAVTFQDVPCGGLPNVATLREFLSENYRLDEIVSVRVLPPKLGSKPFDTRICVSLKSGAKEIVGQEPPDWFAPRFWGDGKGAYEFARHHGIAHDEECRTCPHRKAKLVVPCAMGARYQGMRRLGKSFSQTVNDIRLNRWDVGLIGNYLGVNYGSHITYYALYEVLNGLGYSTVMIDRPLDVVCVKNLKCPLFVENPYPAHDQAPRYKNILNMKVVNGIGRVFVTGSDQLFNNFLYRVFGKFMAQGYVRSNHHRILYAGSFGHDFTWGPEYDRAEEAFYLSRFDAISVREDSAVAVCKREFGVDAEWVLDPVFLCPKGKYDALIERAPVKPMDKPYLFSYVLDPSDSKEDIIIQVAQQLKLEPEAFLDADRRGTTVKKIRTVENSTAETWLAHIAKCSFAVVDSFHGMCIAIIYHRDFIVIVNKRRGETRFVSLLRLLGLEDRMIRNIKDLNASMSTVRPIDWAKIDAKLGSEAKRSIKWLVGAIERGLSEKRPYSAFDMVDTRCDELELRLEKLERPLFRLPGRRWFKSAGKDLKAMLPELRECLSYSGFWGTARWFFSRLSKYAKRRW